MNIINAKDIPLNLAGSGLPNMSAALSGLFQPMSFTCIRKSLVEGLLQEITFTVSTKGVREPWTAQQLMVKPEGQRDWKWQTLRCLSNAILVPDDQVIFDGQPYRVMQKYDWKEYGYLQYDLAQDFAS